MKSYTLFPRIPMQQTSETSKKLDDWMTFPETALEINPKNYVHGNCQREVVILINDFISNGCTLQCHNQYSQELQQATHVF